MHLGWSLVALLTVVMVDAYLSTAQATARAGATDTCWAVVAHAFSTVEEFLSVLEKRPIPVSLAVLGIALAIEIEFLLIAGLFGAWGALDEPIGQTYREAIRRTWAWTPFVVPAILTVGFVGGSLERWKARWNAEHPSGVTWPAFPAYPNLPPDDPAFAKALADYQAEFARYNAEVQRVRPIIAAHDRSKPWAMRASEPLLVFSVFACNLSLLTTLLWIIGRRRMTKPVDRPPLCEACGYNVLTIAADGRCPECGVDVVASIGPEVRPGAPWAFRASIGHFVAWSRTWNETLLRPTSLGRRIRVTGAGRDHRSFLFLHMPVAFLIGAIGLLSNVAVMAGAKELLQEPAVSLLIGCVFGCGCVIGTLGVVLAAATGMGLWIGLRNGRNLLPASMQAASYLVTYLVLWEVFGAATACGAILLANDAWLYALQEISGVNREVLAVWVWIIPNSVMALLFIRQVYRVTYAARFANR